MDVKKTATLRVKTKVCAGAIIGNHNQSRAK
jgi:hypothetical protein